MLIVVLGILFIYRLFKAIPKIINEIKRVGKEDKEKVIQDIIQSFKNGLPVILRHLFLFK